MIGREIRWDDVCLKKTLDVHGHGQGQTWIWLSASKVTYCVPRLQQD